ncbi:PrgI family protein, partial [Burkholderia multivorans]
MSNKHSAEEARTGTDLVPVKFSRLTRRGILLGLSATQLATLAVGVLSLVGAFYAGGMLIAYTAPIWVSSIVLTWMPVAGRPVVEWVPVAAWWLWRTTG